MKHFSLFALFFVLCTAVAQTELKPDVQYAAGTRVKTSSLGISFVIPAGWLGGYKQEGDQALVALGSKGMEGVGLAIFMKNQTPAQVSALLNDSQDLGGGVVLDLVGSVKTQANRITARYLSDEYVGRALALLGNKNHVIYFYAGPHKNEAAYAQILEGLAKSTQFIAVATPKPTPAPAAATGAAKQWTQFLNGMMLRFFSSYNSGGGGGGMSDERTVHFCSDGSFAFLSSSLTTMNVPGASASSGGNDRVVGRWRVESATQASAIVVLTGDDGSTERFKVEYDGEKTFLNGRRWFRVESDACR